MPTPQPNPALPSTDQMNNALESSGVLEKTELPPQASPETKTLEYQRQNPFLASTSETPQEEAVRTISNWGDIAFDFFLKGIGVLLTAQGIYGIYSSLQFIVFRFPLMEAALHSGALTRAEINQVITESLILIVTTVVSLVFAVRLTFMTSKNWKILNAVVGVLLLMVNTVVQNYFSQLDVISYLSEHLDPVISTITNVVP